MPTFNNNSSVLGSQAEEPEENQVSEKEVISQPQIAASGDHRGEHYWVEDWKIEDDEYGRQHVICTLPNCWQGTYYDPKTQELIDGQIKERRKNG